MSSLINSAHYHYSSEARPNMGLGNLNLDLSLPEGMRSMEAFQFTRLEIGPSKLRDES